MADTTLAPIDGPEDWSGASLRGSQEWIAHLGEAEIADIDRALAHAKTLDRELLSLTREDFPMPLMDQRFDAVRAELEGGRGFALLRGLPIARYTQEDARLLFWGLSQHLGEPQEQDGAGNRLHSVTNTGMRVEKNNNVRSFQTDDELTFHCDGGDAFMLLCLRTAKSGGISKLVSAAHLYNEILRRRPDLIEVLQQDFHFDTRGQHLGGVRFQSVPIFNFFQGRLSMLYKRRYLRTAQEFPEVPKFTKGQQEAVELIESLTNDPEVQLSFYMEPGDLQIANNYAVLHARSKYEDFDEPERRRHLFRAWVTLPNGRALPPAFATTREFGTSYARRHGAPAKTA
ncbi:MAG: taurine catabolism dioxygenase TauD [Betaproteobacteria bacterium]|nr:taurine catabolism dioxygenase TauD [Betaproteobacteria bacterium]